MLEIYASMLCINQYQQNNLIYVYSLSIFE